MNTPRYINCDKEQCSKWKLYHSNNNSVIVSKNVLTINIEILCQMPSGHSIHPIFFFLINIFKKTSEMMISKAYNAGFINSVSSGLWG